MPTIIPWRRLAPHTLDALIEEFVTRDGTDYGVLEASTTAKVEQVKAGLRSGECVISYDERSNSVTIIQRRDVPGL
ncbi:MAG: YheU family protein [Actinomycetota bacterium]|nr:YheU family protein [Actinomycetota bacterium]MEE2789847.1 YheU family protein [Myxococcota bacterium]